MLIVLNYGFKSVFNFAYILYCQWYFKICFELFLFLQNRLCWRVCIWYRSGWARCLHAWIGFSWYKNSFCSFYRADSWKTCCGFTRVWIMEQHSICLRYCPILLHLDQYLLNNVRVIIGVELKERKKSWIVFVKLMIPAESIVCCFVVCIYFVLGMLQEAANKVEVETATMSFHFP